MSIRKPAAHAQADAAAERAIGSNTLNLLYVARIYLRHPNPVLIDPIRSLVPPCHAPTLEADAIGHRPIRAPRPHRLACRRQPRLSAQEWEFRILAPS